MALKPLDLKALTESTEKVIALSVGEVRARRLSRMEFLTLMPPPPPGYAEWKPEEASAKEAEWLESLSPADRVARRAEMLEAMYAAIARAIVEPVLSVEQVKRLGDDAFVVWAEVQAFWQTEKNGLAPEVISAAV